MPVDKKFTFPHVFHIWRDQAGISCSGTQMAGAERRPRRLLLIIFIIVLDVSTGSFYVELSNQSLRLSLCRIQTTNSLFFPPQTVGEPTGFLLLPFCVKICIS